MVMATGYSYSQKVRFVWQKLMVVDEVVLEIGVSSMCVTNIQ